MSEPVKVLCGFKYMRLKASPWRFDSVMIQVDNSQQINDAFINRAILLRYFKFELVSYLPEHGRRKF